MRISDWSSDVCSSDLKLFIAGMIAFAIAVKIGLPQPYWALVTCCVVMNPITGAIRSKAIYRFMGTLGAGVVSLVLAAIFVNTPVLLIAVMGLAATDRKSTRLNSSH